MAELTTLGFKGATDQHSVLPSLYQPKVQGINFEHYFTAITDRVQELRRTIPDYLDPDKADLTIRTEVAGCIEAMQKVHRARLEDNNAQVIIALDQHLSANGYPHVSLTSFPSHWCTQLSNLRPEL